MSNQKPQHVWLKFTTLGLQMGLTIFLGSLLGEFLDNKYPSESVSYHKIVTLFAVFGSIVSVIRQVIQMQKEDERKK
jgi:hypothetical protein